MIERALKTDQMDFIYTVWSYRKNYSYASKKQMTFEYLFSQINEICRETAVAKINQVVYWTIKTNENMLKALLTNNADFSAIKYFHLYFKDVNMELLIFCIKNTNQDFLRKALKDNVFTGHLLDDPQFIDTVLDIFKFGSRIDLLLNVLGYMQFTKWTQKQLKTFVEIAYSITHEKFETNIIVLASNPVLCICLICECLTKIGDYTNFLKKDCENLINQLLIFGKKIIDGVEDSNFYNVFFDSDFKDRTLMRIIAERSYDILFKGERVDLLLHEIWQGEGTKGCNGGIIDFSVLEYLAKTPIRSIRGQELSLK